MSLNLPMHLNHSKDPATLVYPPTLPVELALKTGTIREICESYGIDKEQWEILRDREDLRADVMRVREQLKQDGMSFKFKAMLQSEELLKTSWQMIHKNDGSVPANVRSDLIKATWRVAGLEPGKGEGNGGAAVALQIVMNL